MAEDKRRSSEERKAPEGAASGAGIRTGLVYDARCLLHKCDESHFESPLRASGMFDHFKETGLLERCVRVKAREATSAELETAHTVAHIRAIERAWSLRPAETKENQDKDERNQLHFLDSDTFLNAHSCAAAKLACGGLVDLCLRVVKGELNNGFAILRPPGHHAFAERASGFCLFNNTAVAAGAVLAARSDVQRVLILDWDVHHGNGTQAIVWDNSNVLYMSVHRSEGGTFYPRSGFVEEVGGPPARGGIVNVPLPCTRLGDAEYEQIFRELFLPIAREFSPDLVIVAAGFDAARGDPLGGMEVSAEQFAKLTRLMLTECGVAQGRVVLALEGGYSVRIIRECGAACLRELLNLPQPAEEEVEAQEDFMAPSARELKKKEFRKKVFSFVAGEMLKAPRQRFEDTLAEAKKAQAPFWKCLRVSEEASEEEALVAKLAGLAIDTK